MILPRIGLFHYRMKFKSTIGTNTSLRFSRALHQQLKVPGVSASCLKTSAMDHCTHCWQFEGLKNGLETAFWLIKASPLFLMELHLTLKLIQYQLLEFKHSGSDKVKLLLSASGHGKNSCDGVGGLFKHLATEHNFHYQDVVLIRTLEGFVEEIQKQETSSF